MKQSTNNLINKALRNWDMLKVAQAVEKEEYSSVSSGDSPVGKIQWENPLLLWILVTGDDNEDSYSGSTTQVGLSKDGRILWEYQSHCSCDGYENSDSLPDNDFPNDMLTKKSYELEMLPEDWEDKIAENIQKLFTASKDLIKVEKWEKKQ